MRIWRIFVLSLVITGGLAAIMSWPLPKHFTSGMPISNHNPEDMEVQAMVPGDHLQFLYHVWLAKDALIGETPLFCNPYEFNLGDDADRKNTAMRYYLPFPLFFSLGASFGNQVLGWNFMGFVSLWITWLFTWLLVKRYTENRIYAIVCASISIILPYRWFSLLGGSPTGLAMAWVPVAYYGLDVMVRDKRMWGAVLAGAAVCLSEWSDSHLMFFMGISAPFWCILSYLFHHKNGLFPSQNEFRRYLLAASPLLIFVIVALFQVKSIGGQLQETGLAQESWPLAEVATRSPRLEDAFRFGYDDMGNQTYIGYFTFAVVLMGVGGLGFKTFSQCRKGDNSLVRSCLIAVLLFMALVAIWMLGAGTNMPGGARSWQILTKIVPPYGKLRQAGKIFSIMPVVLAVEFAVLLPHLLGGIKKKAVRNAVAVAILIGMTADYGHSANPPICVLDERQGAYEAIKKDAVSHDTEGHLLVIPLWPGDSHWSSIYQYYVSLYRLRMVNGYNPAPKTSYINYIRQFESFNMGYFPDAQIDELLSIGVEYIVIHEDAFPEKVSLFAVSHTINALFQHPRIKFLAQDKAAWAFKILDEPSGGEDPPLPGSKYAFPSRLWQAEWGENDGATMHESSKASGGKYISIADHISKVDLSGHTFAWFQNLCYQIRIRSEGTCKIGILKEGSLMEDIEISETFGEWVWRKLEITDYEGYRPISLQVMPLTKDVDVDAFMLATSNWESDSFKQSRQLPATDFFHAGYTDMETGDVVLEPERVPADVVFYGPKLPVPAGSYRIELEYSTNAEKGTVLGELRSRYPYGEGGPIEVVAGEPAVLHYRQDNNLLLCVDFVYSRRAMLRIKQLVIEPRNVE